MGAGGSSSGIPITASGGTGMVSAFANASGGASPMAAAAERRRVQFSTDLLNRCAGGSPFVAPLLAQLQPDCCPPSPSRTRHVCAFLLQARVACITYISATCTHTFITRRAPADLIEIELGSGGETQASRMLGRGLLSGAAAVGHFLAHKHLCALKPSVHLLPDCAELAHGRQGGQEHLRGLLLAPGLMPLANGLGCAS